MSYSTHVSVNGYATNGTRPPEPMIHVMGQDEGEHASLTFTPEDARKVAAIMISFANQVDLINNDMEWRL